MSVREPTLAEAQNCLNWNQNELDRCNDRSPAGKAERLRSNISSLRKRFPDLKVSAMKQPARPAKRAQK